MIFTGQVLLLTSLSVAAPTPDQVKAVFDHFYSGQGKDVVLADAFLCKTIEKKKKETKSDCIEPVNGAAKGDTVSVYMTFLVPKGDEKELMIQSVHNGVVRATKDFTIKGVGMRSRTWRSFSLKKTGKWEFKILNGETVMKTVTIDVP